MSQELLYHITTEQQWQDAKGSGEYLPKEYIADGFVHASFYRQLKQTADFFFSSFARVVVLEIDQQLLDCEVIVENTTGGSELFPHIYGKLPEEAVIRTFVIENDEEKGFVIPPPAAAV
jgi:uncharacterized protein (DUF952 family)